MKGEDWPIVGYVDRFSVVPGGTIRVMVSTDQPSYSASVVRFGGDEPQDVNVVGGGNHVGRIQPTYTGSYVMVPHSPVLNDLRALTVHAWIFPTSPRAGRLQGLVTKWAPIGEYGWGLFLDEDGRLLLRLQAEDGTLGEIRSLAPLEKRRWYRVAGVFDGRRSAVRLCHQVLGLWPEMDSPTEIESSVAIDCLAGADAPLLIGAGRWRSDPRPHALELYGGKIENPCVFGAALDAKALARIHNRAPADDQAPQGLIASWNFSIDTSSANIKDTSPNQLHGIAINMPMRATTGHCWRGKEQSFTQALDEYAAIHFHNDDLSDAGWEPDFELVIPQGLSSGAYAIHLTAGTETDDIPFFVTPPPSDRAEIAFLAPTLTYLAYGNEHSRDVPGIVSSTEILGAADLLLAKHPEYGRSLYDSHSDGSGCCYASRLRPIVTMRPDHRNRGNGLPRHYPADLLFIQWLERRGYRYDVFTDEDLHAGGRDLVSTYRVVVTGSHPEYYTEAMLEALHAYVRRGGKLVYLGGNGFYWVTSLDKDRPHIIEVRRGVAGTRDWSSEPGDCYHSTTGEFGGLWRHRGRAPNSLVGVGFCAVDGTMTGSGYVRQPDSFRKEVSFIFRGLGDHEIIGDFGAIGGGAAGDELDRLDFDLGTPASALLLASSSGVNPRLTMAIEDICQSKEATNNSRARADMVYYANANGGAVFSVGSINWFGSLGFNGDQNNVSRVTENVLRTFVGLEQ